MRRNIVLCDHADTAPLSVKDQRGHLFGSVDCLGREGSNRLPHIQFGIFRDDFPECVNVLNVLPPLRIRIEYVPRDSGRATSPPGS